MDSKIAREDVVGGVGGAREDVVKEAGDDVAGGARGAREVG